MHGIRICEWNWKKWQLKSLFVYETTLLAIELTCACVCYVCACTCVKARASTYGVNTRLQRVAAIWMKGESLHRSRYRQSVCVIKVLLSESIARLNKVFRWTEFRVTLWRKMTCKLRVGYRIENCILSQRFSILNLANEQSVTLQKGYILKETWKI